MRKDLTWSNFYLGVDLALATLAATLINLVDSDHLAESQPAEITKLLLSKVSHEAGYTGLVLLATLGALFVTMILHQRYEYLADDLPIQRWKRGIILGLVANAFGGSPMALFTVFKIRGLL